VRSLNTEIWRAHILLLDKGRENKMKRFGFLVLLSAAALALAACGRKAEHKVIGVSLLTKEHVFYRDLEKGLREAAAKHDFDLIINSGDWDLARHQAQLENYIVQKVDAIIVCPVDSKGIGPAIQKANAAGIPVFTADIKAEGGRIVSQIASDNVAGGRLAAEYMAKLLGGRGEVAIIDQPVTQSVIDRVRGFLEVTARFPEIRVVARPSGDGVRDRAMKAAEDLLQGFPNLAGIFGINDDSALGALAAVEAAGRKGIVIVGYDGIPEARTAILRGSALRADVVQYPIEIGRITIETIARHLAGEAVAADIPVKVGIVDAASAAAN
jgi:ribose transport system substrate-binding protein